MGKYMWGVSYTDSIGRKYFIDRPNKKEAQKLRKEIGKGRTVKKYVGIKKK